MPTVSEQQLAGYAHCEDPMCSGSKQQPVDVVRSTVSVSYVELGGDLPGFERSFEHYGFADEADRECPVCGKPRAAATQERPVYPTSQYAQDGLLKIIQEGAVKPMSEAAALRDGEIDELKAQIAELKALVSEKRGPGRPRKEPPAEEA